MNKKFNLISMILLGINAIIGSGIFLLPNKVYSLVGNASLLVIIFDAILVISLCLCFAEASSLFKGNGGPYIYARAAFGDFVGFEVGFIKWVVGIIAWATIANAFATALGEIWPVASTKTVRDVVIISIIVLLGSINLLGVSSSKWVNNIITFFKLVPLILFIVLGIFYVKKSNFMTSGNNLITSNFGKSAILLFYAFANFESIPVVAEDMEEPQKNLPKTIMIVILLVSLFYLAIQFVTIGILGGNLAHTVAPVQAAMTSALGKFGFYIIALGTLVSIGGLNLANAFIIPRTAVALADDKLLPSFMAKRSKNNVPYIAVIVTIILTLPIALSGSFTTLAAINVVSRFAQYLPTCLAVIVFRKTKANEKRSFKIPFGIVIPIFAIGISLWLLTQASTKELIYGFGGLLVGIPIYLFQKHRAKTS